MYPSKKRGDFVAIPQPKKRLNSEDGQKVVKVRARKPVSSDLVSAHPRKKFDDRHVRWTGYLTIENNRYLRDLLAKGEIRSITRCVNEAVETYLKSRFGLSCEDSRISNNH